MARRLVLPIVLVLASAGAAWADLAEEQDAHLDAIVRMAQEGVSDDVIVKHIRATGFVFDLTADDILQLRDLGLSDVVLEALLDTALEGDRPRRRRAYERRDYDSSVYLSVSAGYFSPWYWYPYAWGFYYDPFPYCYSFYYYPFRYTHWGYYGYCNTYYYRWWWRPYRYDHPRYYAATRHRQGGSVRVPVRDRGVPVHVGSRSAREVRVPAAPAPGPRQAYRRDTPAPPSALRERSARDRVYVRPPRAAREAPAPGPPGRRYEPSPRGARGLDTPAPAPRRSHGVDAPAPPPRAREHAPPPRAGGDMQPRSVRPSQGMQPSPPRQAPSPPPAPSAPPAPSGRLRLRP